jgi:aspartate/methionine/tyrosine aminotransferase
VSGRWAPFKLERFFARYEFEVPHVLCASDCQSMTVAELLALEPGADARLQACYLGYTDSRGSPELREAIAAIYETVTPDEILVHSGAEEAIFLFMHAMVGPGDHVVVQWPCYQSLAEVARGLGAEVSLWRGRVTEGWAPDPDEVPRLLRPNTRAIVINSPHNPTGYQLPVEVFRRIATLAEEAGVTLFSDEVYREAETTPEDRLPAACDVSQSAVSLGVVSKAYGLAGLRIGWLATHDAALLDRVAQLKDYTTICNAAPSELLAAVALRHRATLVAQTRSLLLQNLALLDTFFAAHEEVFAWRRPDAGPIAFPALRGWAAAMGAEAWCEWLAREVGVLLLPGTVYDVEGHVRVGFGRKDLAAGLARLESAGLGSRLSRKGQIGRARH